MSTIIGLVSMYLTIYSTHCQCVCVCLTTPASPPGLLSGVDLVEVNPLRAQTEQEVQSTVSTAVNVLFGCFGRLRGGNHPPDYRLAEP